MLETLVKEFNFESITVFTGDKEDFIRVIIDGSQVIGKISGLQNVFMGLFDLAIIKNFQVDKLLEFIGELIVSLLNGIK